ncbi:SnoaL-like domain-containing protein [Poriferisphaera sp. WC338]|uniref:SnoaL-like domain-containing protein n=1 Tax=Poriferisphaera sp. WC338 TaxID=3425129 RepID=UPI003D8176B1
MPVQTTMDIANQLVALCRERKFAEAINTLYADDIVSVEAMEDPAMPARMEGKETVLGKNQWWFDNHEIHSITVSDPFPHGDRFAVYFDDDITSKETGERIHMQEVALYTVTDGKITHEEFFYQCPSQVVPEVANKLVELCNQGKNLEAVDTLYADDIVSIEAMSDPTMPARMEGIEAIRGKNEWWLGNHEVHETCIKGPFPHEDRFALVESFEMTVKETGKRCKMTEVAIYTVRDGKIAQEQFFYQEPDDQCQTPNV